MILKGPNPEMLSHEVASRWDAGTDCGYSAKTGTTYGAWMQTRWPIQIGTPSQNGHIKISILYNKNKENIGNLQTNHQAETQQCRQNEASGPHTTQGYWWE